MKKNDYKKKIKESENGLSPYSQKRKKIFSKSLFKDFGSKRILLSPKKSQEEFILPKKKIIPNTSHHRRTKSNSQNYIQYMTNNYSNLNSSISKLSCIFRRNKMSNNINNIDNINNYNNYSLVSRNKIKKNFEENKKSNHLLSISFSLKDFRNNIVNAFSHSNIFDNKNIKSNKNKIINLKNDRSVFSLDNIMNIEDTRNTTSITNYNNYNLKYNKNKQPNSKSTQYIKINKKQNKNLYSSKKNSSQIITYTNNDIIKEKVNVKSNLHRYIYKNNNNIKVNKNNNNNNKNSNNGNSNSSNKNSNNNHNNLMLTKKTFRNSQKYFSKLSNCNKKLSIINPISEFDNSTKIHYLEIDNDDSKNKNVCPSTTRNSKKKKIRKVIYNKSNSQNHNNNNNTKRKTKNKENNYKIGINNSINEFKSVEEIHFIFVQINQKKKAFFERNNYVENRDKYKK